MIHLTKNSHPKHSPIKEYGQNLITDRTIPSQVIYGDVLNSNHLGIIESEERNLHRGNIANQTSA